VCEFGLLVVSYEGLEMGRKGIQGTILGKRRRGQIGLLVEKAFCEYGFEAGLEMF